MGIKHLTEADYHIMPWKNGLGQTVEMIRYDDSEGDLVLRLSMAMVTEDGPFSLFPEVERNLTVLSGDGFDLVEQDSDVVHHAGLLKPFAFAGDIPVAAKNVTEPCQDFNVMTQRGLPKPVMRVVENVAELEVALAENHQLAMFALSPSEVLVGEETFVLRTHELLLCHQSVTLLEGSFICVDLYWKD